jgi:hypothetical protein
MAAQRNADTAEQAPLSRLVPQLFFLCKDHTDIFHMGLRKATKSTVFFFTANEGVNVVLPTKVPANSESYSYWLRKS